MSQQMADLQRTIAASVTPSEVFGDLPHQRKREVFFGLPETVRQRLVADMSRKQLRAFVDRLDPDEATDVLGYADEATRQTVLSALDSDRREKLDFLLSFNPESAAGLMDLDYVTVDAEQSLSAVAERVRRFEERRERLPTILVLEGGELLGELPGATLSLADSETETLREHINRFRRSVPTARTRQS